MGNPLYHWSKLELKRIFDIGEALTPETADMIWDKCNKLLQEKSFSAVSLLKRFNVAYSAPCAALNDNETVFNEIPGSVPSLRGDDMLLPTVNFTQNLAEKSDMPVNDLNSFMQAVTARLDAFHAVGCRIADHSLDNGFVYRTVSDSAAAELFAKCRNDASALTADEKMALASAILKKLAGEYSRRNWMLLLHIGAQRFTSSRLRAAAGPAGGFAAIGHTCDTAALALMLDDMESAPEGLPRTVLFTLNPADHAAFSVLSGSFPGDGVKGKVQLGPAWWWCDHIFGMRDGFESAAAFGVLSQFIGMTTDSRSILSFARHDYFRRILCSFLAEENESAEWGLAHKDLVKITQKICYENAKAKMKGNSHVSE
jgi:glucuronate isomerase